MKIGFLIPDFYPVIGGMQNNCYHMAKELAKHHEIYVFTSLNDKKDSNEDFIENINIFRSKNYFRLKYYILFNPGILFKVLKTRLDVLHVHSFGFFMQDLTVLFKRFFSKTKMFNTPHGPFMALDSYSFFENIFKISFRYIEKPFNKLYDYVVQVNPNQSKWIVEMGVNAKKIIYVPNGVPLNYIEKNPLKQHGNVLMTYIGRIQKYKGLDQVIKILPFFNNLHFVAVGKDWGDKKRLVSLAKSLDVLDRVEFKGYVSEKEKLEFLSKSEISILPSKWEAFGIGILEAMARGNVIISTKTEGGMFLVEDEKNGYLYDFNDTNKLKEIVKKLVDDPKLRGKMAKLNIEKSKDFTWDKISILMEGFYRK